MIASNGRLAGLTPTDKCCAHCSICPRRRLVRALISTSTVRPRLFSVAAWTYSPRRLPCWILVHLATIKRFNDKFITLALQVSSDTSLRPPTLHETVQADRTVWIAVATLVRDQSWSLTDSLNEVGFCRHDMAPLLQARPKPARALPTPAAPSSPGKPNPRKRTNSDGAPPSATAEDTQSTPTKPVPKGKAKTKAIRPLRPSPARSPALTLLGPGRSAARTFA